ncbi:hypothetical protein FXO37_32647 [Capsicum annuum]|nr:hypothetical protein FXO37_32647 [Capsicum annuum]
MRAALDTDVIVRCTQSRCGGTRLKANLCKFDDNHIVHCTTGFPIMVDLIVKCSSGGSTCTNYIYDHRAVQNFWIPYDCLLLDDDASNIIAKIIFLMNVPISLELNKQSISYSDNKTTTTTLTNKDTLISKILNFARTMKDFPSNELWYMSLVITKVTYVPHVDFIKMYDMVGEYYNLNTWKRTQEVLDSRIAAFELLQKKIGMKKMRFQASEFEDSNLLDTCSICQDEFLHGCIVSCIKDCSHVYHDICILEWLLRNRTCPYCRSKLA